MFLFNFFLLNFSLGLWAGVMICFSFLVTPTLFRELPREMAGAVVSKIFPAYYHFGYACLGIALFSLILKGILEKPFPFLRILFIGIALTCAILAGKVIHPEAHLQKTIIRTLEDGPEKEQKQKEFAKLHRQSVLLNIVVLFLTLITLILNFTPLKI